MHLAAFRLSRYRTVGNNGPRPYLPGQLGRRTSRSHRELDVLPCDGGSSRGQAGPSVFEPRRQTGRRYTGARRGQHRHPSRHARQDGPSGREWRVRPLSGPPAASGAARGARWLRHVTERAIPLEGGMARPENGVKTGKRVLTPSPLRAGSRLWGMALSAPEILSGARPASCIPRRIAP